MLLFQMTNITHFNEYKRIQKYNVPSFFFQYQFLHVVHYHIFIIIRCAKYHIDNLSAKYINQ